MQRMFGRFGRVRGTASFARSWNAERRMTRRMFFVLAERPFGGFAEQQTTGTRKLNMGTSSATSAQFDGLAVKTEEALLMNLSGLELTVLENSACGILPTHLANFSDYMHVFSQVSRQYCHGGM
jgi:hypothetical protein